MKRKCQKCGQEYVLGRLSFGSSLCDACKPRSFAAPLWLQPSEAGTKDLWRTALVLHVIMLFLFGLMTWDELGIPGVLYSLTITIYLAIRFVIARFRGYPILSMVQAFAFFMLPIYGLALSVTVFNWANHIRWGTRW